MHPFSYTRAAGIREALDAGREGGRYIAGGTTLVDLMRETVERPSSLVDISALPLRDILVTRRGACASARWYTCRRPPPTEGCAPCIRSSPRRWS
jgi:CO/xanthine dehydrogenase FAD-binding subunit